MVLQDRTTQDNTGQDILAAAIRTEARGGKRDQAMNGIVR